MDNNRKISYKKRDVIRQYAREYFTWAPLIHKYIAIVENQLAGVCGDGNE
jgi:hypothetical protein